MKCALTGSLERGGSLTQKPAFRLKEELQSTVTALGMNLPFDISSCLVVCEDSKGTGTRATSSQEHQVCRSPHSESVSDEHHLSGCRLLLGHRHAQHSGVTAGRSGEPT